MSYGIQVYNSDSILTIDDNYSNYAVYSSGTLTSTLNGAGYYEYTLALPNIPGILMYIRSTSNVGTYWIQQGGHAGSTTVVESDTSTSINYILVVPSSALSVPSGYGLNIYRGDGSLAFSSEYSYASLVDIGLLYNSNSLIPASINISAPVQQGRNKYFCISACHRCGYWNYSGQDPGSGNWLSGEGIYRLQVTQNSNLSFDFYQAQNEPWDPYGPPLYNTGTWSLAVLTGYFFMTILEY